jgi:predicted  nucleic acid-binding Zn-ribbon protein
MDVDIIIGDLTQLQRLSRRGGRLSADQKMTVARIRGATPEPILAHFDRLLAQGNKAVAEVRHGVCTGCFLKLPTSLATGGDDDLAICENCGAYLVFPEETPAELTTAEG